MSVSRVLVSAALAGAVALSATVGPAFLPASLGGGSARAEVVVSIDVFHQQLSPYGQWATVPGYGEVWYPSGVGQGWRPYYNDGHWAYSDDYGWMWVSDLPWGWAPFHYGRWAFAAPYGWIWVPGRTWGPAWVTFRQAPDYIGWAPLPPEAAWDPGYGFSRRYDVGDAQYWNFVRPEGFLAPRFDRYAYDRHDYPRIINNTTNITNITVVNNRIVNRSITVNQIEQVTHKRVERVTVTEAQRPQAAAPGKGNRLVLYKPAIDGAGGQKAGAKPAPTSVDPATNRTRQLRSPEAVNPAAGGANLQSQPSRSQKARENQLRSLQPQSPEKANKQVPALQQQQVQPQGATRKKQQLQQLQQQVQPQGATRKKQQLQQLQQQQVQTQQSTRKERQLKQLQQQQQQLQPQKSTRKERQLQQFQPQQLQPQRNTRKERQAPQFQQQLPVQGQPGSARNAQCGGPGAAPCK